MIKLSQLFLWKKLNGCLNRPNKYRRRKKRERVNFNSCVFVYLKDFHLATYQSSTCFSQVCNSVWSGRGSFKEQNEKGAAWWNRALVWISLVAKADISPKASVLPLVRTTKSTLISFLSPPVLLKHTYTKIIMPNKDRRFFYFCNRQYMHSFQSFHKQSGFRFHMHKCSEMLLTDRKIIEFIHFEDWFWLNFYQPLSFSVCPQKNKKTTQV